MIYFNILLFVIGLVMLIKGGDWFVDGASGIARRFHLPELLIGATVVSIGTTLPEVMVSAQGAMAGSGGMAYGNAIGSIICNTALIAAITVAIKPGKIERKTLILPVGFFFAAAIFYVCVAYFLGEFSRTVGIILLCGFAIYMATLVFTMLKGKKNEIEPLEDATHDDGAESEESEEGGFSVKSFIIELLCVGIGGGFMIYKGGIIRYIGIVAMAVFAVYAVIAIIMAAKKKGFSMGRDILFLVIGAGIIAGGANLLVDSGTYIATEFGVPDTVIALTFVALGTSLPELVTAITSLVKGHGALSLGNVIGANLFNIVLVSGVSTVISPFGVPAESQIGGVPASYVLDLPVMLGVMLLLTVPALIRGKLSRVQGILLLCVYIGFCAMQFIM
ncbi:MAG: calcium/sodium antiporter [Clostridia bacterium]|nr:calcium/sodium antiporter [Clostridia bacterium]